MRATDDPALWSLLDESVGYRRLVMRLALTLIDPIREFFTLRSAERTVVGRTAAQNERARALSSAASARLRAGRRMLESVPAAMLLREALALRLRAAEAAESGTEPEREVESLLATFLASVPLDPADPQAADARRVREALQTNDPLYFDGLSPEELERTRQALDRACARLRGGVEVRSRLQIRALRWGRAAAVVLVAAYAVIAFLHARYAPVNVALGKPVRASSRRAGTPDGHELVDGDTGLSYAMDTNVEDNPNVVIDLQGSYAVDRVDVHNRVDGWFDECLPLVVELSSDGSHYDEIGKRDQHFDANPPWSIAAGGRVARFVRLRLARHGALALSEVEVFGKRR
jgi:hypothetical protein